MLALWFGAEGEQRRSTYPPSAPGAVQGDRQGPVEARSRLFEELFIVSEIFALQQGSTHVSAQGQGLV